MGEAAGYVLLVCILAIILLCALVGAFVIGLDVRDMWRAIRRRRGKR